MRVRALADADALRAMAADWDRLWRGVADATPFQHPAWLLAWWHTLPKGTLEVLAAERDGTLAGLLPLCRVGAELKPLGFDVSDYAEPLAADGAALRALLEGVAARPGWEGLTLTCRAVPDLPPGLRADAADVEPAPVVALPEGAALPGVTARNLRQSQRRLEAMGDWRLEEATAATARELIEVLFDLHGRRWQSRGEEGVLAHPAVQAFHREAAERLAEAGLLRLSVLWIGEAAAGVFYGMRGPNAVYCYLGGLDPAFAPASPGALLILHEFRKAVAEGCSAFDFLMGQEAYKYGWGAVDRPRWSVRLTRGASAPAAAAAELADG